MADARTYPDQTAPPTWLVDKFGNALGTQANPLQIAGTFTPAANQRVSSQSGDFVAGSVVDLATLLALAGTAGDANTVASLMGRLTKIRDVLNTFGLDNTDRQKVSLYGKNAANADTPFSVDSGGRLLTHQTLGGNDLSATNPLPIAQFVEQLILNGQGFSVTTGKQTSAGAGNTGACLINPVSSTKNVLVYSIQAQCASAGMGQLSYIIADPALTAMTSSILNASPGNATTSVTSAEFTNAVTAPPGTISGLFGITGNTLTELLTNRRFILFPKSYATSLQGIYVAVSTSTNVWGVTFSWVEF